MTQTSFNNKRKEMDLPKFVVFNSLSNKNYLRPGGINSYMKFETVEIVRWGVKHEVQKAKYGGGLVHVKCCDTGKYWSWGLTKDSVDFITAQADQPEEDTAKRGCTLIKLSYGTKYGIHVVNLHVMYLGKWYSIGVNNGGYLVPGHEDFVISNWELLAPKQPQGPSIGEKNMNTRGTNVTIRNEEMALPKFVVFNSLLNKNYLRPVQENSYIKFDAVDVIVDVISWGVKHEIQKAKSGGGLLHIRCCDTGKYWSWGLTDNTIRYIVAQANQSGEDTTTRACTLIKPSQYTKDGVTVVNLQVMYEGTWWSVGGDGEGYLVVGGEDFVISDWESLPPKQPQGPSVSDINMNTGGDHASIRNEKINANPPSRSDVFQAFPPLLYSLLPLLIILFFVFQKTRKTKKARNGPSDGDKNPNNGVGSRGNGRDEDFIQSDLDLLLPKQPNGPSNGDKNPNNGVGSSIGNTTMGGGFSMEKSNVRGNGYVSTEHTTNIQGRQVKP